jgi:uncharacterized repeat protein (TIGR01451 family)
MQRRRSTGYARGVWLAIGAAACVAVAAHLGAQPLPPGLRSGAADSAEPPSAARAPGRGPVDPPVPQVVVRVRVPAEAIPNERLVYHITVANDSRADAHHVLLKNPLPSHVTFVSAKPEPNAMTPVLLWELGTLKPCAKKEIELVVMPTGSGDVRSCARVQYEHGQCVQTRVARPGLQLAHTGPAQAALYDVVTFKADVTNNGKAPARNVSLSVSLPEGVEFQNSKPAVGGETNPLVWDLGEVAGGQSKRVEYSLIVKKTGTFTSRAAVTAGGGLREEAAATVQVGQPALAVVKSGPKQRAVGRPATYRITVRNPGTLAATNVELADELPADISFARASDGGEIRGEEVRWTLGRLEPGASRTVEVAVRAKRAGKFKNVVTATADRGLSEQGRAETQFAVADGLVLEFDRPADPVEGGPETTYTVRAVNLGKAAEKALVVTVIVPDGLSVVDGKGPTPPRRDGQKLVFEALDNLAAGMEAIYSVRVRPERAGESKWQVEAASERTGAGSPVRLEETPAVLAAPKKPVADGK